MSVDRIKTMPQYILPKKTMTFLAGILANCTIKWIKNLFIRAYIAYFSIDMTLAQEENPKAYPSFNAFFIRHLKPQLRPIANAEVVSPVDGILSELGRLHKNKFIPAKGHHYTLEELLACPPYLAQCFETGQFATFYLAPKDYHRIHMPCDAKLLEMIYVPGKLFSVQPSTVRVIPKLFARNERLVIVFETKAGLMAMILVGAVIVGAINTVWHGDVFRTKMQAEYHYASLEEEIALEKGEEMGHFKLGSTVILIFSKDRAISWKSHLHHGDKVCFGQALVD